MNNSSVLRGAPAIALTRIDGPTDSIQYFLEMQRRNVEAHKAELRDVHHYLSVVRRPTEPDECIRFVMEACTKAIDMLGPTVARIDASPETLAGVAEFVGLQELRGSFWKQCAVEAWISLWHARNDTQ